MHKGGKGDGEGGGGVRFAQTREFLEGGVREAHVGVVWYGWVVISRDGHDKVLGLIS
jgi:hypothetical protein